jgi:hypothetical protein
MRLPGNRASQHPMPAFVNAGLNGSATMGTGH